MAGWLVVAVIFYFIGRSLVANWDELAEADLHFDIWLLVASFIILGLWMLAQAYIWHVLTVSNGAHIPLHRVLAVRRGGVTVWPAAPGGAAAPP